MLESEIAASGRPPRLTTWGDIARTLYINAKKNSKVRGKSFGVNIRYIGALMAEQDYKCAVTGIPFSQYVKQRNPYAPSMDRIDNKKGYVPGNIRMVLYAVNLAMNVWGEDPLREIAVALTRHTGASSPLKTEKNKAYLPFNSIT